MGGRVVLTHGRESRSRAQRRSCLEVHARFTRYTTSVDLNCLLAAQTHIVSFRVSPDNERLDG